MTNRKELAEKLVDGRRFQEKIEDEVIIVVDSDEEIYMDSDTSEDEVEIILTDLEGEDESVPFEAKLERAVESALTNLDFDSYLNNVT